MKRPPDLLQARGGAHIPISMPMLSLNVTSSLAEKKRWFSHTLGQLQSLPRPRLHSLGRGKAVVSLGKPSVFSCPEAKIER
jgi:hypothetical protein